MRFSRHPRLSRFLVLLALFQMMVPSLAAIADAWRLDQREAYVHIESETTSTCVVVHAHDCLLCSVATAPTGALPPATTPTSRCDAGTPAIAAQVRVVRSALFRATAPRAPPAALS